MSSVVVRKELFLTSECTACKVCLATNQFVKMSNTRAHANYDSHKGNEDKVFRVQMEKAQLLASLYVVVVPQNLRPHEVGLRTRAVAHTHCARLQPLSDGAPV